MVFSDIVCGWATVALHRFYRARERLGLTELVRVDHQLFLLEDVNEFPIPKRVLDVEIPVVGALEPEFGWKPWRGDASTWPITSLLANEAVHAAKQQSLRAAEDLDLALRRAFFADSRPISLLHEILDIASSCASVDITLLRRDLDEGSARAEMMRTYRAQRDDVAGSPYLVLPDGYHVHNPGIALHWEGEPGAGFPVVDTDDPAVIDDLLERAAQTNPF